MSDDELEKLAAEMQNIKPSEDARTRGMEAAMAAFDMEFATELATETVKITEPVNTESVNILNKNIDPAQGLEAEPRPTGQSTLMGAVQTAGRTVMTTTNKIFSFKPRTAMLMGSCATALIAAMVIMPNMSSLSIEDQVIQSAKTDKAEISVDGAATKQPSVSVTEPTAKRDEAELSDTIAQTTPDVTTQSGVSQGIASTPPALEASTGERPSNVVTIERQILKSPARVEERVVPALTEPLTRRAKTRAERMEWRQVPLTPEDAAKGKTESFAKVVVPHQYQTSTAVSYTHLTLPTTPYV